jgi:hypothetical protein
VVANLGGDARPDFVQALDLARQIGSRNLTAFSLGNLGYLDAVAGNAPAARTYWKEALTTYRQLGEVQSATFAAANLGFVSYLEDEPAEASCLFKDALKVAPRVGDREVVALALLGLALTSPQPETAAILHGAADAAQDQIGEVPLDPLESKLRDTNASKRSSVSGGSRRLQRGPPLPAGGRHCVRARNPTDDNHRLRTPVTRPAIEHEKRARPPLPSPRTIHRDVHNGGHHRRGQQQRSAAQRTVSGGAARSGRREIIGPDHGPTPATA